MRYFRKKFPNDLNDEKSLLELSRNQDSQNSTQAFMKTEFNGSEFSADLKAELDNINKGIATTIGDKSIENLQRPNSNNAATRNG